MASERNTIFEDKINEISIALATVSHDNKNILTNIQSLSSGIKNVSDEVNKLNNSFAEMRGNISNVSGKVDALDKRVEIVENKSSDIATKFLIHEAKVKTSFNVTKYFGSFITSIVMVLVAIAGVAVKILWGN